MTIVPGVKRKAQSLLFQSAILLAKEAVVKKAHLPWAPAFPRLQYMVLKKKAALHSFIAMFHH